MFRRAIDLEPELARAHAGLGYVQLQKAFYAGARDARLCPERDVRCAGRGALRWRDSLCRCVLGRAYCMHQQYEEAIAELEETVAMNPSFAQGYFALASR
jgi:tetratricopeptide (TPR) repeat protein